MSQFYTYISISTSFEITFYYVVQAVPKFETPPCLSLCNVLCAVSKELFLGSIRNVSEKFDFSFLFFSLSLFQMLASIYLCFLYEFFTLSLKLPAFLNMAVFQTFMSNLKWQKSVLLPDPLHPGSCWSYSLPVMFFFFQINKIVLRLPSEFVFNFFY